MHYIAPANPQRQLLIPAGLYIATATACTILIFPQSLNHIVLTDLVKTNLKPMQSLLRLQDQVITTLPSDKDKISELSAMAHALRSAHVQGVNALDGQMAMLQLEITRGQIGPRDLARVFEKAKQVGTLSYALASFVVSSPSLPFALQSYHRAYDKVIIDESHKVLYKYPADQSSRTNYRTRKQFDDATKHRHPGTGLDDLVPIVARSTADLRAAADKGLNDAIEWLDVVNHSRWTKVPASAAAITVREANLASLKSALSEFRSSKHFEPLEPYRDLFDDSGNLRPHVRKTLRVSASSVFRCNVFMSTLIAFSAALTELLEMLLEIERANPKARIQLPSAFARMLVKTANIRSGTINPLDMGNGEAEDEDEVSDDASSTETLVEEKHKAKVKKAKTYGKCVSIWQYGG